MWGRLSTGNCPLPGRVPGQSPQAELQLLRTQTCHWGQWNLTRVYLPALLGTLGRFWTLALIFSGKQDVGSVLLVFLPCSWSRPDSLAPCCFCWPLCPARPGHPVWGWLQLGRQGPSGSCLSLLHEGTLFCCWLVALVSLGGTLEESHCSMHTCISQLCLHS